MPKDRGAALWLADHAYGSHPRQSLDVYAPSEGAATAPLLMFIYGGSWDSGCRRDYGFVGRAFAARGFVTAIPDYRLVPEVGFPEFVEDCGRALVSFRQLVRERGLNAGPVALVGHSAGAYNAVMLALDRRLAQRCGYGRGHIAAVAGIAGPYDFLPLRVRATKAAFAAVADLEATQPIALAGPSAPPMLLLHGSADNLVGPGNASRLAEALVASGSVAETAMLEGQGHLGPLLALARPFRRRVQVLQMICRFLEGHQPPVDHPGPTLQSLGLAR